MNHYQPDFRAFNTTRNVKIDFFDRSHVLNNMTDYLTDPVEYCMNVDRKNLTSFEANQACLTAYANYVNQKMKYI